MQAVPVQNIEKKQISGTYMAAGGGLFLQLLYIDNEKNIGV